MPEMRMPRRAVESTQVVGYPPEIPSPRDESKPDNTPLHCNVSKAQERAGHGALCFSPVLGIFRIVCTTTRGLNGRMGALHSKKWPTLSVVACSGHPLLDCLHSLQRWETPIHGVEPRPSLLLL